MKKTDVVCPLCGTINHNLYLEETDGWMECECCGSITKGIPHLKRISVPVTSLGKAQTVLGEPA